MKKSIALCLALVLTLSLVGCGNTHKEKTVFDTENIKSVTFFTPNAKNGLLVPEEDLAEIVDWLGSFTVGEKADKTLKPGSNSITVRIEYTDGNTIECGLSTTDVENTTYYMDYANAPECYTELING